MIFYVASLLRSCCVVFTAALEKANTPFSSRYTIFSPHRTFVVRKDCVTCQKHVSLRGPSRNFGYNFLDYYVYSFFWLWINSITAIGFSNKTHHGRNIVELTWELTREIVCFPICSRSVDRVQVSRQEHPKGHVFCVFSLLRSVLHGKQNKQNDIPFISKTK